MLPQEPRVNLQVWLSCCCDSAQMHANFAGDFTESSCRTIDSSQRRSPRLRGSTARVASTPPRVLDLEESRSASFHLNPLDLTDRPTASPCPERALLSRLGSRLAEERLHRRAALLSKLPFSSALPGRGVAARKGQHHYLSPLASLPSAAVRKRPTLSSRCMLQVDLCHASPGDSRCTR